MAIAEKLQNIINEKTSQATMTNYGLSSEEQINSNTKFIDYPKYIFKAFIESLNNPNTLWGNLPKITGTGTSITLNNTIEAPMKLELNPSELEQETTTGKNLLPISTRSNASNGITSTANADGTLTLSGTTTGTWFLAGNAESVNIPAGTYTFSIQQALSFDIRLDLVYSDDTTQNTFTIINGSTSRTATIEKAIKQITIEAPSMTNGTQINTTLKLQLESGSSASSWEKYTGSIPAPNPDYPQQIHTISGDNEIVVSNSNHFNTNKVAGSYISVVNDSLVFTNTSSNDYHVTDDSITLKTICPNLQVGHTYMLSFNTDYEDASANQIRIVADMSRWYNNTTLTMTEAILNSKIGFYGRNNSKMTNIDVYESTTTRNYVSHQEQVKEINLGSLEYCKIGDYKDKFAKSSGKNLFNTATVEKGSIGSSGDYGPSGTSSISINGNEVTATTTTTYRGFYTDWIEIKPNRSYALSYTGLTSGLTYFSFLCWYDENYTFISRINNGTNPNIATSPATAKYARMLIAIQETGTFKTTNIQLEEGSSASEFEPYGSGQWYIKKNIGKVVLDGSEANWTVQNTGTSSWFYRLRYISDRLGTSNNDYLSNNYTYANISSTNDVQGICITSTNELRIRYGTEDTIENYKLWLSTHNTIVYYILATPTYTLLNDTLQTQLEDIYNTMKSYNKQTNINQNNNDLAFNISSSAIEDIIG